MLAPLHVHLADEAATRALGERVAAVLQPGASVHLSGDLGAGKTTLARGLIRALGFPGQVKSPSYALVEPYTDSRLTLYHFDFFRFKDPGEWRDAGLSECFNERAIWVVEWPEKAAGVLPPADLRVRLEISPRGGRDAAIEADTELGRACLSELARRYAAR
ncbi:MAG: tRNA (adenosine(37)-N6)-threonylcarbamoyltransferase complex ATPase subunit type 1 TsaE [Burkholderiales bacterium]